MERWKLLTAELVGLVELGVLLGFTSAEGMDTFSDNPRDVRTLSVSSRDNQSRESFLFIQV